MLARSAASIVTDAVYIARGADAAWAERLEAFCRSYNRHNAGCPHRLHVVFKGFANAAQLGQARSFVADTIRDAGQLFLPDSGFDLGAYYRAASRTTGELLCCLNSASVILGDSWLAKLVANLRHPGVGLVGCTGSYEAPQHPGIDCPAFPNPHLRSNAFLIERKRFLAFVPQRPFATKLDAYLFEHGLSSLTRQVQAAGLKALLVGRNGRGYDVASWSSSETFRQGSQSNLLIGDNQTRLFEESISEYKRRLYKIAWGDFDLRQILSKVEPAHGGQESVSYHSVV